MNKSAAKPFHPRLMILANAGSGKTHALVTRCLKLLSLEQKPEDILALTFTRKAAAEFLQKLFGRLGEAAQYEHLRTRLAEELGLSAVSREQCLHWMRRLIAALPRLSMGTMDQFFGRIVRGFPFELGLARDFELLNDAAQQENLYLTLDRLFREATASKEDLRELFELLRQSGRNRSDASALRLLRDSVMRLHAQIVETPEDVTWGDPEKIWGDQGCAEFLTTRRPAQVAQDFFEEMTKVHGSTLDPKLRDYLEESVQRLSRHASHAGLGDYSAKLVEYLGKEWKFVKKYQADTLRFGNYGYLPDGGNLRVLCAELRRALIGDELQSKLASSAALYKLLRRYERIYKETVREAGRLTFSDVTEILAGSCGSLKDDVAYRLDSRYRHWLLDEFQDTSRAQWNVMEPLVAEVLMDTEGDRSFFYVGDTKQAIYGWRGGDDRLFREIFRHYNKNKPDHIIEENLALSWRSDPVVIEVVNAAFNEAQVVALAPDFNLPVATVERWKESWVQHSSRKDTKPGFVRLHDFSVGESADDDEALDRELVRLIKEEVKPQERGLTCAVLTRSSAKAEYYANVLEDAGIEVTSEGRTAACMANPESLALMAAIRGVASPKDALSQAHFLVSPLGRCLVGEGSDEVLSQFRASALCLAAEQGFAAVIHHWMERLDKEQAVDTGKIAVFAEAAMEFDAQRLASDDWHSFLNHLTHYTRQENEVPGAVRVMTVHKAKGLGMDMVILPELGGAQGLSQLRLSGVSIIRDEKGKVLWGLELPREEICEEDEVLRAARDAMKADAAFEEFCVFYVAMTRAKHAVYCLFAEKRKYKNAARWLMRTFPSGTEGDVVREMGDAQWFQGIEKQVSKKPTLIAGKSLHFPTPTEPAEQLSPSYENHAVRVSKFFGDEEARELGIEVHSLLAQITWLEELLPFRPGSQKAKELVEEFLKSSRAVSIFQKPKEKMLLWREKSFDVETEGRLLRGVFDRVHILLDEQERPRAVRIYDFKTDKKSNDLLSKYQGQMTAYIRAVAQLLDLEESKIEAFPIAVRC